MSGLVLSNSRSNTFRRCEHQYEFKYVRRLRKKDLALPLFRGDWLHQLLMVHYDGHPWRQRHNLLIAQNWSSLLDEEKEELGGDLPLEVERIFKGYLAHWKEEDSRIKVVDTEINEIVELPNGDKVNIIVDIIWEESDGGLWVVDHKTVSRFYPLDFMLLDSQLALYFWGMAKLGYKNLRGALLNELITKPPTAPKFNEPTQRFAMRKNLHSDAYSYYAFLKAAGVTDFKPYKGYLQFLKSRHDEWWRRTRLPRDKAMVDRVVREMMATGDRIRTVTENGVYIRTARKECQFDCDFLEPCMAELQGLDIASILKMKYQTSKRPPEQEELRRLWPSNN